MTATTAPAAKPVEKKGDKVAGIIGGAIGLAIVAGLVIGIGLAANHYIFHFGSSSGSSRNYSKDAKAVITEAQLPALARELRGVLGLVAVVAASPTNANVGNASAAADTVTTDCTNVGNALSSGTAATDLGDNPVGNNTAYLYNATQSLATAMKELPQVFNGGNAAVQAAQFRTDFDTGAQAWNTGIVGLYKAAGEASKAPRLPVLANG